MTILFVNTLETRCGVHQYGANLYWVMGCDKRMRTYYTTPHDYEELVNTCNELMPDIIIYNWQAGIGGWMKDAPFPRLGPQVLVYHDLSARFNDFDLILFSDPTAKDHDNWRMIGRPLATITKYDQPPKNEVVTIGVNGFIGAWAVNVVNRVLDEFDQCRIRLHLPYAVYGDAIGQLAQHSAMTSKLRMRNGVMIEAEHDFKSRDDLIQWLMGNDINCYFRPVDMHWTGVSSALDCALLAGRPIAINRCNAFRHMHDCSPSICIEDHSLKEIISAGIEPLKPKLEQWSQERVAAQVYDALLPLCKR